MNWTREEVKYRLCETLNESINVSLDYDRSHQRVQRLDGRYHQASRRHGWRNGDQGDDTESCGYRAGNEYKRTR